MKCPHGKAPPFCLACRVARERPAPEERRGEVPSPHPPTLEELEEMIQGERPGPWKGYRRFKQADTVKRCACGRVIHPLTTPEPTEVRCVKCRGGFVVGKEANTKKE